MLISSLRHTVSLLLLILLSAAAAGAWEYHNDEAEYYLDLPEGWTVLQEQSGGEAAFLDRDRMLFLQVFRLPARELTSAAASFQDVLTRLGGSGEGAPFHFSGRDAVMGEISFSAGRVPVTGYLLIIRKGGYDFALVAYAPGENAEEGRAFLFSVLDSFSPDAAGRMLPGAVSQFFVPFPGRNPEARRIKILGREYGIFVDPAEFEATANLIEREARLVIAAGEAGSEAGIAAWKRYYRLIYRDSYHRLAELSAAFAEYIEDEAVPDRMMPHRLLSWIQSFSYQRTGTFSDLLPPQEAGVTLRGDCDSRALLYVIMLHHYSVDAALFVSSRYSHAVAGVGIPDAGARLEAGGASYLLAETTESIDMGMIAADMADPSGWIAVPLGKANSGM